MLPQSTVSLHPQTIKHMKNGHPWVTDDSFTKKFPQKEKTLLGISSDKNKFAFLLHDPHHKKIKARLWGFISGEELRSFKPNDFWQEFNKRVEDSLKKRQLFLNKGQIPRDNYYLIFGESDFLPGLFLQKIKNHYIISLYSHFWDEFIRTEVKKSLLNGLAQMYPTEEIHLWVQIRNKQQEKNLECLTHPKLSEFELIISEYNLNYKIRLNSYYDFGIYTDMSAIRPLVLKKFKELNTTQTPTLLNLFSYTSAYSLYFLGNGFKTALSVDLSKKYLDWSNENYELNPSLKEATSLNVMCMSAEDALKKLLTQKNSFDLIISDPPSVSSDGEKKNTSFHFYEQNFDQLVEILSPKGLLVLFINTHTISRKKFEEKIQSLIEKNKHAKNLEIVKRVSLELDCPTLKGFIEGDYLKGIFVAKKG